MTDLPGVERSGSAAPAGVTLYVVGDLHGRADLLRHLLERLSHEPKPRQGPRPILVFLGDYVDRGPDSRGVIDTLLSIPSEDFELVPLMGNHDWAMITFLTHPEMGEDWLEFGGAETLASYGVPLPPPGKRDWRRISEALAEALPHEHAIFLTSLRLTYTAGDYFFCHAGARPDRSLAAQTERDLLWIRDDFLLDPRGFDKVVVHGHTVEPAIHSDGRRIGLDTGAYATGLLSIARLRGRARDFLTVADCGPAGIRSAWEADPDPAPPQPAAPTPAAPGGGNEIEALRSRIRNAAADLEAQLALLAIRARRSR